MCVRVFERVNVMLLSSPSRKLDKSLFSLCETRRLTKAFFARKALKKLLAGRKVRFHSWKLFTFDFVNSTALEINYIVNKQNLKIKRRQCSNGTTPLSYTRCRPAKTAILLICLRARKKAFAFSEKLMKKQNKPLPELRRIIQCRGVQPTI